MFVRALTFREATYVSEADPAFVEANLPKRDVERAVQLAERLCKPEAENL